MNKKLEKLIKALGKNRIKLNEPMSQHTYFKIGGPADMYFEANSAADLVLAIKQSLKLKVPFFVLGGGSNILVSDKGIRGLVIKNRAEKIKTVGFQGKVNRKQTKVDKAIVEVESGALLNKLSRYCIEEGLKGFEVFLSVPGTVGGAIYNNSHYRPEKNEFVGNLLHRATLIDSQGKTKEVSQKYFNFGYDYSILHQTKEIVIKAKFILSGADKHKLWKKATELVKRRNKRQPIGIACSGCTFQNISQADALRLGTPNLTQSAGYLIDRTGLKGKTVGGARVSQIHASFIENTGKATAEDVLKLIKLIQKEVFKKFGVKLKPEIFLVGDFK